MFALLKSPLYTELLGLNLGQLSFRHCQLQPPCGLRALDLAFFNDDFFGQLQLSDAPFDIKPDVVWLEVAVDAVSLHVLWNLDFEDDASLVLCFVKAPLVPPFVGKSKAAVLVVDGHFSLLIEFGLEVVVPLEHTVFL